MTSDSTRVRIYEDDSQACRAVAQRVAARIRERAAEGRAAVLGLFTGHTPVNLYRELIRLHRDEGLDFSRVATFNLDEYWPIDPNALQSYNAWMRNTFLRHVNIRPEHIHIPR
ncbi:MAG: 6-phosphogluconolactonase, partial [Candidatus Sumerlaeota bacterium]|nr:6-phosphogluconolactonase [Candidatus Sumerlaeota bacterium]